MKKNCVGVLHPQLHQGIVMDPLGDLQLPPYSQLQLLLAWAESDVPIFFLYYPLISIVKEMKMV